MKTHRTVSGPAISLAWAALALGPLGAQPAPDLQKHIAAIQAVGGEGAGNAAAANAFKHLSESDADAILPLLKSIAGSGPLARNWIRSAVEVITERARAEQKELPQAELRAFVLDRAQAPEARRFAYELLVSIDPDGAGELVPGFVDDPSTELRREAVARLMDRGRASLESGEKDAAGAILREALDAARDVDQIQAIAKELTEELGQEVDLPRHFGFLMSWHVIGPFGNSGREGFSAVYAPEEAIDLAASYPGEDGAEAAWQLLESTDPYGKIDLNEPFGKLKEVTGYAYHEFLAEEARPAELRLGCKNAWKVWLNGELLFGRDEYHRGQRIDQYKMPVNLKKGKNTILVKLCQNEQKESWTKEWEFQLRVCDATGTAILASNRAK